MTEKKKGSIWRTASLTVILLFVCAVLSVATINLVVIPFLNAANQPTTMTGAVPQIAQATATVDFDEGPPPPGTPTGELPTPLPTLSKDQLHNAPTAEYPPGVATLEPIRDIDAIAPTFAPVVAVAPSEEWITYKEPNLGFSFNYPNNWFVEGPEKSDQLPIRSVSVIIRNYEDIPTKGDKTVEQLRIEIGTSPLPDFLLDLDAWTTHFRDPNIAGLESNASLTPTENIEVDGTPAVRWTVTAEMIPQGSIIVGVIKDGRIYAITGYPATSKYLSTFDRFISSFRFR